MIIKDGVEYRNLEEQVLKNQEDIAYWMTQLATYGFKIIGKVATAGSLPDAQTYTGAYGDAYAVGSNSPYYIYVYTKPNNGGLPSWTNIGQFPLKGDTGAAGADGQDGTSTMWYADSGYPTVAGNEGDMYLRTSNYYVYRFESGAWTYKCNIKGETGATGPAPVLVAGAAVATQVSSTDPAAITTSVSEVATGTYAINMYVDIPQGAKGNTGAQGAQGVGVNSISLVQNLKSGENFDNNSVSLNSDGVQYTSTGYMDYGDGNISPTFTMTTPIKPGYYTTVALDTPKKAVVIDVDTTAVGDAIVDDFGLISDSDIGLYVYGQWNVRAENVAITTGASDIVVPVHSTIAVDDPVISTVAREVFIVIRATQDTGNSIISAYTCAVDAQDQPTSVSADNRLTMWTGTNSSAVKYTVLHLTRKGAPGYTNYVFCDGGTNVAGGVNTGIGTFGNHFPITWPGTGEAFLIRVQTSGSSWPAGSTYSVYEIY